MDENLGGSARTVDAMSNQEIVRNALMSIAQVMRSVPMGEAESWQLVKAQMVLSDLAPDAARGLPVPEPLA